MISKRSPEGISRETLEAGKPFEDIQGGTLADTFLLQKNLGGILTEIPGIAITNPRTNTGKILERSLEANLKNKHVFDGVLEETEKHTSEKP